MATSIERGGRVVCTAAAAVEVRAAGLRATNQPRARHHRAPMPHVGSFGLACARTFRGVPRVVGVQTAGDAGRGEVGGALQKGFAFLGLEIWGAKVEK
jgi:hypothetical protein